jgi:hypothetical protein
MDFPAYSDWNPMLAHIREGGVREKLIIVIAGPGGREWTIRPRVLVLREAEEFRWKVNCRSGSFRRQSFFRLVDLGNGRTRFVTVKTSPASS